MPHSSPPTAAPDDPLLDTDQASAYYRGSPSVKTMERWRALGTGPKYIKMARRVFYRRSALDAYLDQCTRSPGRAA